MEQDFSMFHWIFIAFFRAFTEILSPLFVITVIIIWMSLSFIGPFVIYLNCSSPFYLNILVEILVMI